MLKPLQNALDAYVPGSSDEWTGHALLGITSLYMDDLTKSLAEFNTAMLTVPDKDAGDLFLSILRLSAMSSSFRIALHDMAPEWRDKLSRSPEWDTLSPSFDRLVGGTR
jgi:hypothetical protein